MIHALTLALLPLVIQGTLNVTVVGDSTGFTGISETDSLNHGRNYWIEPQTRSFARTEQSEHGRRMIINGEAGPWFHVITRVRFSPDGTRLVYTGRSEDGDTLVVDGEVIAHLGRGGPRMVHLPPPESYLDIEPDEASGEHVIFSPDSRHIAWVLATRATEGPPYEIVLDFEPVAAVDHIGFLAFTPASELVWSTTSERGPGQLFAAGQAGPEFERIDRLRFAAESGSFAYRGTPTGARAAQVLVNHEVVVELGEPPYAGRRVPPGGLQFSSDLSRVAVLLEAAEQEVDALELLVDGERVDSARRGAQIAFAPDGRLFHQRPGGEIVLEGEVHGSLGTVLQVSFAPVGDERLTVTSAEAGVLVIDGAGVAHGPFTSAPHLEFSPDGAHTVFIAGRASDSQDLYLDGQRVLADVPRIFLASFSDDSASLLVTAADSSAEVWAAAAEQAQLVGVRLIGTNLSERRYRATSLDGETRAAFVRVQVAEGEAEYELQINGQAIGEPFAQAPAAFGFDADGVLRFLSRRGDQVLLGEYRP